MDPRKFYDDFAGKLVRDFLLGNKRAESAILFASNVIKREAKKTVLDLGCGIGWSTYEFSRACPDCRAVGVDLSDRLVALASRMFSQSDRVHFYCGDLTSADWCSTAKPPFDACVMIDVYEHIPRPARQLFHETLKAILSEDAVLILTCPTPLHQKFLRQQYPDRLQPVDEDVHLRDLEILAEALTAEITHYEHKSIWAGHDYFHAVMQRRLDRINRVADAASHRLLPKQARWKHVQAICDCLDPDTVNQIRKLKPSWHRHCRIALRKLFRMG
jgi:cyclopropane fatty-acyl-phospholipid synthase-like methyltransferase